MALSKLAANSFDLTDNYAFTGTTTGATSTQKLFLIKNLDASSSSTLSFVNGSSSVVFDNTYKTYYFKFINVHPATDNQKFQFQATTDGSNFNTTVTTTTFIAAHKEDDSAASLDYESDHDISQGTGFARLASGVKNDNDSSCTGELWFFNPSSTTFVKHWFSRVAEMHNHPAARDVLGAGYFNTTSAITGVQFKMASGNIDSGRIALYGIK